MLPGTSDTDYEENKMIEIGLKVAKILEFQTYF
jgi:hypothetical protein